MEFCNQRGVCSDVGGVSDSVARTLRTVFQLIVALAGTGIVSQWADGLDPAVAAVVLAGFQAVVTFGQNWLEEHKIVPAILKKPETFTGGESSSS
jgi:hypothetical protein